MQVVKVYPIVNDEFYSWGAAAFNDGEQMPMGIGRAKAQSRNAAVVMSASAAGFENYEVVETTLAELYN